MYILAGNDLQAAQEFIEKAVLIAQQSTCQRSKCGAIIVNDSNIIGQGFNSPPGNLETQRRCNQKHLLSERFKSDKTCCVHAEQRAVMDALAKHAELLPGSRLYFIRLDSNDNPQFSGQPYCTICSKMSLDAGIAEFSLVHESGITIYNTEEYNQLSLQY